MSKKQVKISVAPYKMPDFKRFSDVDICDINDDLETEISIALRDGFNFFNYDSDIKDAKKWFVDYITRMGEYTIDEIKIVKNTKDYNVGMTHGSLARMLYLGLPAKEEYTDKIREKVNEIFVKNDSLTNETDEPTTAKPEKPVITVRDRMVENLREFLGEYVEGEIDEMYENNGNSKFKLAPLLITHEIPGKQADLIVKEYQNELDELTEVLEGTDCEDLIEAYSDYSKPVIRKMKAFFQMLVDDATHHAQRKKATRKTRAKKKPSVEKLVAKVKYRKSDDTLKLVSEGPENIIGAKEVWLYNTKTRKLTKLIAKDIDLGTRLTIKGTTVQDYDEIKSVQKNLRNPKEILTDFKKAGKVALRSFIEKIKAKASPAKGRLNADTIILKTIK